jgi:glycosyltransferase involved in cell wall biosynthesis
MTPIIRIVHIITGLSTGGAEMSLYRLLSGLSPEYLPYVISLTTIGEVGKRVQELGIPVEPLGMKGNIIDPFLLVRLTRKLKVLKPDLVHTWMYHSDLVGGLAARIAGAHALVWAIRNSNLDGDKTKWTTRAVVRICAFLSRRMPDKIISCSHTARDIHVAVGYDDSRFVIIPNGFELSCFRPDAVAYAEVRQELGIPVDAPVIGIVGRFDPQKNHQGFIEAAGILHAHCPDVHFVMIGKNLENNNPLIAGWIQHAEIENVTHLLGLRDDIPRLTASFDIAVSSSSWGEAFPNVIGEAMACGVPCVVTDVGDAAYIVSDTGRVVPPGDMKRLAGAMKDLLALSPADRGVLGARARNRVAENFEMGSVVRQYESFYNNLANQLIV